MAICITNIFQVIIHFHTDQLNTLQLPTTLQVSTKAPVEGLGSHSGVLGNKPGGVWVKLRSLGKEESKDSCLPKNPWGEMNL